MLPPWRFLSTGPGGAAYNMALDEALLAVQESGATPPTLRVYAWSQPTLSLGYAQNARQDLDLSACESQGVTVVRRPTGGRAVLHDQEVTYSVVMPLAVLDGADTITAHYHRIGLALAAAFQLLGLPVQLTRPPVRAASAHTLTSPACFAALSRYELSIAGRKLVGSAQKRGQRALLQHGSIPLWLNRQQLFQCLRVPATQRAALVHNAYATMGAINEYTTTLVTAAAVQAALRQGFSATFGRALVEMPLSPDEECLRQHLQGTKYITDLWNLEGAGAWRRSVV